MPAPLPGLTAAAVRPGPASADKTGQRRISDRLWRPVSL
jgi:hypothetical protein